MTKAIEAWVKRNQNHFKDSNEKNHLIEFLVNKYGHKNSINFSYPQCVLKAEAWVNELNKENLNQVDLGRIETVFEKGPYKIIQILDQVARNYEGAKMSNCVAKYKDEDDLYSLRDKENIPHCTIEIKNGEIEQLSGRGNGPVYPKYVDFLLSFIEYKNVKIDNRSIYNIGYVGFQAVTQTLKNLTTNVKIKTFNDIEYVYCKNTLKFKKPILNESEDTIHLLMSYFCRIRTNQKDLVEMIEARKDLLIKESIFEMQVFDKKTITLSPIGIASFSQDPAFVNFLVTNYVDDCSSLTSVPMINSFISSQDEDFLCYIVSKGFRFKKRKDELSYDNLHTSWNHSNLHEFGFRIIKDTVNLSIIKKLEDAGLDPNEVTIRVLWGVFKKIVKENNPEKWLIF